MGTRELEADELQVQRPCDRNEFDEEKKKQQGWNENREETKEDVFSGPGMAGFGQIM